MSKVVFGIDIGGTTIKCGVFAEDGTLLQKSGIPTRKADNGGHILEDIRDHIIAVMEKEHISLSDVIGVGLGVPGSVTADGVVNKCVNLGWGVFNVAEAMAALLELPASSIRAGNDANMAALGEYWKGSGEQYDSLLLVTIGTGVGGGLIIDGKPVNGFHGAAAEIGHLPIVPDLQERCTCGKRGCLEQVASATGIVRVAHRMLAQEQEKMQENPEYVLPSGLRTEQIETAKDVFDLAKTGNGLANAAVEVVAMNLARGLACAAGIADPQCFIIGGGVSAAGDFLLERIRRYYTSMAFHPSRETPILQASLGNDAGMYGAAKLALHKD